MSTTRIPWLASIIIIGLLAPYMAQAKTVEYKFNSGSCGNGAQWWSVTTYEDGVATSITGTNCRGVYYQNTPLHTIRVNQNPILGMTPTDTGIDANGNTWTAVVLYDADSQPYWIGGADGNGNYWVVNLNQAN